MMRCIRCMNGVELPDLTQEGMRDGKPAKPLVAKVDDKTKAFLDEFEATLGRTDVGLHILPLDAVLCTVHLANRIGRRDCGRYRS